MFLLKKSNKNFFYFTITILLLSIFLLISKTLDKNINNTNNVITIPITDLLYKLAPIEFQMIIPGILEKQYIKNVLFAFKGVKPAQYINISFGTNGKLQKMNKETNPALVLKK